MLSKVTEMLLLVEKVPGLEVSIFSGERPDNVRAALLGQNQGTRLHR
jgi:isopentenyl phosphate kinase